MNNTSSTLPEKPPISKVSKVDLIAYRGATNGGNGIEPHTKEAIRQALLRGCDIHVDLSVTKDNRHILLSPDDLGGMFPALYSFRNIIRTRPQTIYLARFIRGMVASLPHCEEIPRIYFNAGPGISPEEVITSAADSGLDFAFCSPFRSILADAKAVIADEQLAVDLGYWSNGNGGNPLRVAQSIGAQYVILPDKGGAHDGELKSLFLRARASGIKLIPRDVSKGWRVDKLADIGIELVIVNNLLMASGCR